MPRFKFLCVAILLLIPAISNAQTDQRYIVSFRGVGRSERAASVQRAGAALRFNYDVINSAAVVVPNANVLAALQRDPFVASIVPDRPIFAIQNSADAQAKGKPGGGGGGGGSSQTTPEGVKRIGLPTSTSNGSGIGVAIVDTGIDFGQTDLAPAPNAAGTSFSAFGNSCQDDEGHGTHVTGIVAALDNLTGVLGVAPSAKPYCVKVLDATGSGSDSDVIAGLDWVAGHWNQVTPQIRVVNMSLGRAGTSDDSPPMHSAIQTLYSLGIIVVVAAGNDANSDTSHQVPAAYSEVFAVASTTAKTGVNSCRRLSNPIGADTASYFTTDGIGVTVSAPGEDQEDVNAGCFISSVGILSTKLGGGTTRMSGTSMASPHVAGVVARILQPLAGGYSVEGIRATVSGSATRIGAAPLDSPTGSYTFDGVREGIVKAP